MNKIELSFHREGRRYVTDGHTSLNMILSTVASCFIRNYKSVNLKKYSLMARTAVFYNHLIKVSFKCSDIK